MFNFNLNYLLTPKGRTFLQITAFGTAVLSSTAFFLPQSYFLDKYKSFVQSYHKGEAQPVPPKVLKLYEQVIDDLNVPKYQRELLEPFTVFGFEPFNAGSTHLHSGAIIGIPINFKYDTESDVDRRVKLVDKGIDWETEAGMNLQSSLVLSESAKKFAIAREIISAQNPYAVWLFSTYPSALVTCIYVTSVNINAKLKLLERSRSVRFTIYSLVTVLFSVVYCGIKDSTRWFLEETADKSTANINEDYAKGGVEFYTKMLERNKAVRELLENGERYYTISGNEVMYIRTTHKPLTERKWALEAALKKYNKSVNPS